MPSKKVDLLNIGLILGSIILAINFPLRLFLYAYTILGPLHYLTQISWTEKNHYFIKDKKWVWIAGSITILAIFPKFFFHSFLEPLLEVKSINAIIIFLSNWSNSLIFLGLASCFGFLFIKKKIHQLLFFLICIISAVILNSIPLYIVIVGLLIPTILHVYFFTLLFMFKGATTNKNLYGYVSVALMILVPISLIFIDITPSNYLFPEYLKVIFTENKFHHTNASIAKFLNLSDGKSFFFYEVIELKILIFIAFAYTYHYLNWFSKTTVIGWHNDLTKKRSILILVVWLAIVALFIYNYKIGFMASLLLSFLHVILEFPLNIISIRDITILLNRAVTKLFSS